MCTGTLGFDSGAQYYTDATCGSVAVADLNGDGKPDLALACSDWSGNGDGTVRVLLNNGDGTFAADVDYPTGPFPNSIAAADLNGDGRPDLAVGHDGSNFVSVLLNNGDGTFATKVDFATCSDPASVAVADLNGDHMPDLVVTSVVTNTVNVLPNNGNGTFGPTFAFATGTRSYSVAVADLNGDSKPDLVVANFDANTVSVLLNESNGSFAPSFSAKVDYVAGNFPASVAAADLNGDGKPDLAVTDSGTGSNYVSVLLNHGDGTFAGKTLYPAGSNPRAVAVADLDGGGGPDLAVTNYDDMTVSVFLNHGNGTFAGKVDFATSSFLAVAAADLNGDGKPDLALPDNGVEVLLNVCAP